MRSVLVFMTIVTAFHSPVLAMSQVTIHGITDTLKPEHEKYANALETAAAAFKEAEELFAEEAFTLRRGWKKDHETDDGDIIYCKHTDKGKMCTVATVLDWQVDKVLNETWTGIAGLPNWNPNINYASEVVALTDHVDIVTYGNNDVLVVTGRDFVSARLYRPIPTGGYIMASRSVQVDAYPEQKGKVRAELHMAAVRFRANPDAPETSTLCDVVMLVDLKGMLPKIVVNQVIPKIMGMDVEQNRKHFKELSEKAKI